MYKNLNITSLGITARQNELIELALTYKFDSFDLDIDTFIRQLESRDLEYAKRFIDSASIKVGSFELPIRWQGGVAEFKADLIKLDSLAPAFATVDATRCLTIAPPFNATDSAYHEYFETVCGRINEIAEVLEKHGMTLAIGFLAASHHREGQTEEFIATPDKLVALVKTVSASNIGLSIDLWDWYVGGGTLDQIKELAPEKIFDVRIADIPENADLTKITESDRLLPGTTGVIPTVELLEYLKSVDFQGPVTVVGHESHFEPRNHNLAIDRVAKALNNVIDPPPPVEKDLDEEEVADATEEVVATTA